MRIKLLQRIINKKFLIAIIALLTALMVVNFSEAASNLNGRILLQVEDKGQAWYVNPLNSKRYYLGRPDDALSLMRSLGLGVSNADLKSFLTSGSPARLSGRILLQVEDKGQAYYVDPLTRRLDYLGRPADAFNLMRQKGLGITNRDLTLILVESAPLASPANNQFSSKLINFNFKYRNQNYELSQNLSSSLYEAYQNSPKVYAYRSDAPPADFREAFYGLFLALKSGDDSLDKLLASLKEIAASNNWSDDELLEFTIALVQYIPYDGAKVSLDNANTNPYFPYETLYLNKGVCSDKTFLAVAILRKLGYGAAILDFPDINHSALGIACPLEYSLDGSGYCYVETTNYFPLGVIPRSINNGQAQTDITSQSFFDRSGLGRLEIYQKSLGRSYQGMPALIGKINNLRTQQTELSSRLLVLNDKEAALDIRADELENLKNQLDAYYLNRQFREYNNLVVEYNQRANEYNIYLEEYRSLLNSYNSLVSIVNGLIGEIYQK